MFWAKCYLIFFHRLDTDCYKYYECMYVKLQLFLHKKRIIVTAQSAFLCQSYVSTMLPMLLLLLFLLMLMLLIAVVCLKCCCWCYCYEQSKVLERKEIVTWWKLQKFTRFSMIYKKSFIKLLDLNATEENYHSVLFFVNLLGL